MGAGPGGTPDLSSLLSMLGGLGGGAAGTAAPPPQTPAALASLLSNPHLLEQAAASDPRLAAMLDSVPGMRESLSDGEFMRRTAAMAAALFGGGALGTGGAAAGGGAAGGGAAAGGMPDLSQLASMLGVAGGQAGAAGDEFFPSIPPVADPETAFASQLSQLEAMGFSDRRAAIAALQATGGSVEAAVERLLR